MVPGHGISDRLPDFEFLFLVQAEKQLVIVGKTKEGCDIVKEVPAGKS